MRISIGIGTIVSNLTIYALAAETPSPAPSAAATAASTAVASVSPADSPAATASPTKTVSPASPGAAGTAPSTVAGKRIDVSKIIGKTEAEKILGESVRDPQPLNTSGTDGYYSKCNYYSTKSVRSLLVRVRLASQGSIDPQKELEQVAANGGALKPVEGLGEKAGMFNGTPQNGLPANVIMLYVVKGNAFVTIGVGGVKDEDTALEKAKDVARKILAKL
jgi:hypothetical protein